MTRRLPNAKMPATVTGARKQTPYRIFSGPPGRGGVPPTERGPGLKERDGFTWRQRVISKYIKYQEPIHAPVAAVQSQDLRRRGMRQCGPPATYVERLPQSVLQSSRPERPFRALALPAAAPQWRSKHRVT